MGRFKKYNTPEEAKTKRMEQIKAWKEKDRKERALAKKQMHPEQQKIIDILSHYVILNKGVLDTIIGKLESNKTNPVAKIEIVDKESLDN